MSERANCFSISSSRGAGTADDGARMTDEMHFTSGALWLPDLVHRYSSHIDRRIWADVGTLRRVTDATVWRATCRWRHLTPRV